MYRAAEGVASAYRPPGPSITGFPPFSPQEPGTSEFARSRYLLPSIGRRNPVSAGPHACGPLDISQRPRGCRGTARIGFHAAAAREAFEEAGVFGRVDATPIGCYLHTKQNSFHFDEHPVDAHLCEVVSMVPPEETHRDPTWFDPEKTKRRLCENRKPKYASELTNVVDRALQHIEARRRRSA